MTSKEWKKYKLGEIADINMGQSPKSEYYNTLGDGIAFLQGNRTFGFKNPAFDTYTTLATKIAQAGDVIMSVRAPVGDLNITPINICIGRGLCSIRMKNNNQEFLYYLMKYCVSNLINRESGTVFGSVNRNDISSLEINVPCDDIIQRKIAKVLSTIDDKIELNNSINNNLEQQAQAIFKSWFVDFEPFGGIMPDDWCVGCLSDIATITMGQSPRGSSYNENKMGTLFFQGRAEFGYRYPKDRLYTTEPKRIAKANDILISVRAPVGDINIALKECCIGRGLAAIEPKNRYNSFVLYSVLNLKKQLNIFNGEGTVFGSINKDSLNGIKTLIPSKEIVKNFEKIVSPMDNLIKYNCIQNEQLTQLRDTLLPKLMSGEIDVSKVDIDDISENHSADKLLLSEDK